MHKPVKQKSSLEKSTLLDLLLSLVAELLLAFKCQIPNLSRRRKFATSICVFCRLDEEKYNLKYVQTTVYLFIYSLQLR